MADQDWFTENAPTQSTAPDKQYISANPEYSAPKTATTAPAPADWFSANSPVAPGTPIGNGPGNQPARPPSLPSRLPQMMRDLALEYAPTIGATIGSIIAPEGVLPAVAMSALGGAAGSTAQQVIQKGAGLPEAPKSGSEFLQRAGTDAAVQGAGELGGQFINKALGHVFKRITPTQLYQSALRPPPSKGTQEIGRMVQGGLDEGIPVSEAGKEAANAKWHDLMGEVSNIVAADPKKPIDKNKVLSGLDDLIIRWDKGSGDPAFGEAVNKVRQNFLARHSLLTGESAQQAKKGIYEEIRLQNKNAFTSDGPNALSTQAKQEIANGLKQELEHAYPQIKNLNARAGTMIELERAMDRAVAREGNLRITPYFAPVLAGIAAGSQHGVEGAGMGAVIGGLGTHLMRSVLEDPAVKSKLAIALSKAGKNPVIDLTKAMAPYVAPAAIRGAGQTVQGMLNPPPGQNSQP